MTTPNDEAAVFKYATITFGPLSGLVGGEIRIVRNEYRLVLEDAHITIAQHGSVSDEGLLDRTITVRGKMRVKRPIPFPATAVEEDELYANSNSSR